MVLLYSSLRGVVLQIFSAIKSVSYFGVSVGFIIYDQVSSWLGSDFSYFYSSSLKITWCRKGASFRALYIIQANKTPPPSNYQTNQTILNLTLSLHVSLSQSPDLDCLGFHEEGTVQSKLQDQDGRLRACRSTDFILADSSECHTHLCRYRSNNNIFMLRILPVLTASRWHPYREVKKDPWSCQTTSNISQGGWC